MRILSVLLLAFGADKASSFSPQCRRPVGQTNNVATMSKSTLLKAGGFEWEDPAEVFDQGVENPFKNPDLMKGDGDMKIDPARLLGPRLQGTNLYFIGMMGSGKSAIGDIIARREYYQLAIAIEKSHAME